MSPHQTIAVAIRLFAIWLAVYLLRTAPEFFLQAQEDGEQLALVIPVGISILSVLLLAILWLFPRSIAKGLLSGSGEPTASSYSPDRWFAVGCSLLGLWLMTQAIPGLLRYLIIYFLSRRMGPDTFLISSNWHAGAIYYLIECSIGMWLFFCNNSLRRFFVRLQNTD